MPNDTRPKISCLLRRKLDRQNNEFFVGRCRLPANIQLDRFIFLVFPFAADKEHGEEEGAELVFELAHEDSTYRNASRTLKRVAEKIRDPEQKGLISDWLESISEERGSNYQNPVDDKLEEALRRAEAAEEELERLKKGNWRPR